MINLFTLHPDFLPMLVIKNISDLKSLIRTQKEAGKTIGFVPTMGALSYNFV